MDIIKAMNLIKLHTSVTFEERAYVGVTLKVEAKTLRLKMTLF